MPHGRKARSTWSIRVNRAPPLAPERDPDVSQPAQATRDTVKLLWLHVSWILVSGVVTVGLVGCGRSQYPETAPVEGTITLNGAPVEGATVTFAPEKGRSSSGRTNNLGKYTLTYKQRIQGAVLGRHQVKITKFVADTSKRALDFATTLNAKQREMDTARGFIPDQTAVTEPNRAMTGMEPINILPARYGGTESILTATVEPRRNVLDFDLSSDEESMP